MFENKDASEKADVLIEAMKWIREHRGKITVIKLGGSLMEDEVAMMHLIIDLVSRRSNPILRRKRRRALRTLRFERPLWQKSDDQRRRR